MIVGAQALCFSSTGLGSGYRFGTRGLGGFWV